MVLVTDVLNVLGEDCRCCCNVQTAPVSPYCNDWEYLCVSDPTWHPYMQLVEI